MNTQQYKLIDAPVPVKTIKNAENRHLTAIEKKAIKAGMNQGVACFKSGRKIYTISHIDTNHYCVEIEEKETTIFNRLETVSRKVPFSVCLEKAKDEVKEKSIEQIEAEQLELMLTQEKSIEIKKEAKKVIDNSITETVEEAKEETIDNTAVKTVKEAKPKNKVAKLQAKLKKLNAQLSITKGRQNQHKLVEKILKIEATIEQLEPKQENPVPVEVKEKEIEVKDIIVKIPVSVSTLKKHTKFPSSKLTDKEIINGWKYSLAAQSMQRDFRTQKDIQWGDRHLLLNIVYFVDQYQQEMDKRRLTEKYCLWIEKKQAFKDEFYEKPIDAPVTKKDEFCKKPEKATIKFLESKFNDAQIEITDRQIILKSETSELKLNCFVEIPYIDEYYNHDRRKKLIKRLRDGQTSKAHSVCEYIGSILLTA